MAENGGNGEKRRKAKRELALLLLGMVLIIGEFINSEVLGRTFHYEFLILAAGLCGVAIAWWGGSKNG